MTHLMLMRHAEAQPGPGQEDGGLFSTGDEPLSQRGRRQAQAIGQIIADGPHRVDAVHTSPSIRCQQTAEIACQQLPGDPPLAEDTDLLEIPYHEPGAGYDEILATIVATARRLREEPDPQLPTGVGWQQATGRFAEAIDAIVEPHDAPLVVAHGAQNRAWLADLLGMPAHHLFFLEQDHGCLNLIAYGDAHPVVQKLNLTPGRLASEEDSLAEDAVSSSSD